MITYTTQEVLVYELTNEGAQLAEQGSHESRVWNALPLKGEAPGLTAAEVKNVVGAESAKFGQGAAFKKGWIGKDGDKLVKLVSPNYLPSRSSQNTHHYWLNRRSQPFSILRGKNCSRFGTPEL